MPDLVMVMVNMTKTLKPVPATKTKLTANDANLPRVSKIYSINEFYMNHSKERFFVRNFVWVTCQKIGKSTAKIYRNRRISRNHSPWIIDFDSLISKPIVSQYALEIYDHKKGGPTDYLYMNHEFFQVGSKNKLETCLEVFIFDPFLVRERSNFGLKFRRFFIWYWYLGNSTSLLDSFPRNDFLIKVLK